MKLIAAICALLFPLICHGGVNNTNYVGVTEIKVWASYLDIYSEAEHVCSNQTQPSRFILNKDENEMYSLLLAAMTAKMVASISYDCSGTGVAEIDGVRVKP